MAPWAMVTPDMFDAAGSQLGRRKRNHGQGCRARVHCRKIRAHKLSMIAMARGVLMECSGPSELAYESRSCPEGEPSRNVPELVSEFNSVVVSVGIASLASERSSDGRRLAPFSTSGDMM